MVHSEASLSSEKVLYRYQLMLFKCLLSFQLFSQWCYMKIWKYGFIFKRLTVWSHSWCHLNACPLAAFSTQVRERIGRYIYLFSNLHVHVLRLRSFWTHPNSLRSTDRFLPKHSLKPCWWLELRCALCHTAFSWLRYFIQRKNKCQHPSVSLILYGHGVGFSCRHWGR